MTKLLTGAWVTWFLILVLGKTIWVKGHFIKIRPFDAKLMAVWGLRYMKTAFYLVIYDYNY